MTSSSNVPALRFESIEEVLAVLRARGRRISTPCRLVLETLFAAEGPVSAQYIVAHAAIATPDPSSIYRNLERLERAGVVRHVHLGHGPSLYMLVGSGEREFLVCERCEQVMALAPAELRTVRRQIHKQFGYTARFTHFPIVGVCADCARLEAAASATAPAAPSSGRRP